jgi:3alpha(or 20beta)-hydroxysteroid dehydrogenase
MSRHVWSRQYLPAATLASGALLAPPEGIRVNSVHPGPIDTDMIAFRTPEQTEARLNQVPMHRHGTPEQVAQSVAFLLSDESS